MRKIPKEIEVPVLKTLAHYPELDNNKLEFRFVNKPSSSVMSARPTILSFFKFRKNRYYVIRMRRTFVIDGKPMMLELLPEPVLIGWLGHELGHVMDYRDRSFFGLIRFAIGYLGSDSYIRKAERRADEFAVRHGLSQQILETKNFILNNADLSARYKAKIKRLYLSPEQIMEIVNGMEESKAST